MGRLLKHREKDNKWRLWTTISDGWLTDWLTEEEMKEYIVFEYEMDHKLRVIDLCMKFPDGYYDTTMHIKDGRPRQKRFRNTDGIKAFGEWQDQRSRVTTMTKLTKNLKS